MHAASILLALAMAPAPASGAAPEARVLAAAVSEVCVKAKFDRERAQAALERLGWVKAGSGRTARGTDFEFTRWEFPLGEAQVGYEVIGGVELKTFSCSLILKSAGAPTRAELEAALEALLSPARFQDSRKAVGDFTRVARITNRADEQATVTFAGNRVPMRAPGGLELRPGFLIDYSYTKGVHAKELRGH